MERLFKNLTVVILALGLFFAPVASADDSFKPPAAISVTDAFSILFYTTNQIVPDAFVVLDLCLNRKGGIQKVEVLRDPVSMAKIATSSMRTWKFRPASKEGEAVASEVPVVFVYRPANMSSIGLPHALEPINLKPAQTGQHCAKDADYVPAGIVAAAYPDYPVNSVAWGSVVIQVAIDTAGSLMRTEVLHPMPSFTQFALDALRRWRFQAATLDGQPVDSSIIVAFVFQTPSNPF